MSKLLLIGPLTNKKDSSKTGGTVVLFELLLNELEEKKITFNVIDTLKTNYSNLFVAYLSITFQLLKQIKNHEYISLHATANSLITIGPIMVLLSKIFNRKTSVRKFAGNFHEIYQNSNKIKKKLIKYVLKNSSINFFETKYLVEYFSKFNKHTYWFPNVRRPELVPVLPRQYRKRFIYIGSIIEEKGIDEIIEVVNMLDDDYTVDLYGPIIDKKYSKDFFKKQNINYKGSLISTDVTKVMNNYDVLILPSYREGYPGVIIEAFSLGIPPIVTKLDGIMEMVEDHKNALLIDVKSSDQLFRAIMSFDKINYALLSQNALKSFDNFNSFKQTELFLSRIGFNNLKGEIDEHR